MVVACLLDTGTRLFMMLKFCKNFDGKTGLQVGSPDEVAYKLGWIDGELQETANKFGKISMEIT